jgi:prepilin-type N-terminal cleavage/methylation domain-containing protein
MRSTDLAKRWRSQRGVSLIEVLVAAALLGIGVVAGLTAWNTATLSANRAVRQAWAQCIVRSELDAILSMTWSDGYTAPQPRNPQLHVDVLVKATFVRQGTDPQEQLVTIVAREGASGVIAQASALKLKMLAGTKNPAEVTGQGLDVDAGCPSP